MAGTTIVFTRQFKDEVLDMLPSCRAQAISIKDLYQHFPDHHRTDVQEALLALRNFGLVKSEWVIMPKGGRRLLYWRAG